MKTGCFSASRALLRLTLLGMIVLLIGCGGDEESPAAPPDTADINAYLRSLPTWDEFCPQLPDEDAQTGDASVDFDGQTFCRTTPCSITQTPEKIVTFGSMPNVLYLGSLIQGKTYLGGLGSMEILPIYQRTPLKMTLHLNTGSNITRTVEDPDASTVASALNSMVSEAAATGVQAGSSMYWKKSEMYSLNQAALKLGLSFRYMDVDAQADLDVSTEREEHTLVAYFKQKMYEVSMVLPQTPGEFFSDDFTQERLDEQVVIGRIGPDNLPVFVSRIQYGRIMMFTMTSTRSVDSMRVALEASYESIVGGGAGSIEAAYLDILDKSEYTIATIGGSSLTALNMLKSGNLADYFAEDDPITTGEPIAYALCNLADNSLAKVSETTSYDLRECVQSTLAFFTDWEEWKAAFDLMLYPNDRIFFPTDAEHVILATEVDAIHGDTPLPQQITFEAANTGLNFSFYLKGLEAGCAWPLTYDDGEIPPQFNPGYISIGDVDNCTDDDFEIVVTETLNNGFIFAMGFILGQNSPEDGEEFQVYDGSVLLTSFRENDGELPHVPDDEVFMGIVSMKPITKLKFLEHYGGDDIHIRNFYFGIAYE